MANGIIWYHSGPELSYLSKIRWDRHRNEDQNAEGPGLYWTTDPKEALRYGKHLYQGTTKRGFRFVPKGKPTLSLLLRIYETAPAANRLQFIEDFGDVQPKEALSSYANQPTILDACILLYHDLFGYDADAYVKSMQNFYDGFIAHGGHPRKSDHLIAWSPEKMTIKKVIQKTKPAKTKANPIVHGVLSSPLLSKF